MEQSILVVDDDAAIRYMLTEALTDEGVPVQTATNGKEALTCIQTQRPRLVLLDLQMPIMTGWQLLTALRDAQIDVPVVIMTAGLHAQTEAARCGVAGYLAKPFRLDDLLAVVERYS